MQWIYELSSKKMFKLEVLSVSKGIPYYQWFQWYDYLTDARCIPQLPRRQAVWK